MPERTLGVSPNFEQGNRLLNVAADFVRLAYPSIPQECWEYAQQHGSYRDAHPSGCVVVVCPDGVAEWEFACAIGDDYIVVVRSQNGEPGGWQLACHGYPDSILTDDQMMVEASGRQNERLRYIADSVINQMERFVQKHLGKSLDGASAGQYPSVTTEAESGPKDWLLGMVGSPGAWLLVGVVATGGLCCFCGCMVAVFS